MTKLLPHFDSGFGIYDPEAKLWREELLKALI